MVGHLVTVTPPSSGIYRLARGPANPFESPDWDRAHEDGTFGNRFDDPSAEDGNPPETRFRVIYCATQRIATFGETVARFRPSLDLLRQLEAIDDDESVSESLRGAVDPEDLRRGLILADWRMRRRIGHTVLDPGLIFVDITHAETMQHLRTVLAPFAAQLQVSDIDLSSLTSQQRRLTQCCARYIYELLDDSDNPRFAGIRYLSRLNGEWECWAVFDDRIQHMPGWPGFPANFFADDEDLVSVAKLFHLTIEMFSGQDHYIRP